MSQWNPEWKPDASSAFEVDTQLRPWTILDEGMDTILDNCQSMCGINNIYLIVIMHEEHRPFCAPKFPHNPKRESFEAEDSTVCFFPDMKRYGKIKPRFSEYEWIRETDWLQLVIDECRKRNMAVGAEISHFPMPKSQLKETPQWQQVDIEGNPIGGRFCPNSPDVREYLCAIFGDIAANYDIDYLQTCQFIFTASDIDNHGGCFCTNCQAKAAEMGIDLESAMPILREDKDAQPQRKQWEDFRFRISTEVWKEISESIKRENPKCHLRLNDVYSWGRDPRNQGLDLTAIGEHCGSFVNQDHEEQHGKADEDFSWRKKWIADNRKHLGPNKPLISSIAPRMAATPDLVRRGIMAAIQHPAKINGLAFKHYDGASFSLMRAFKQGMIEAGVQGLPPTIGKDVEEMQLDGYRPFTEQVAVEWGVETDGLGKASYEFDNESGTYDIRISYFDAPAGQSTVKLLIADQEVASFVMDENCDCWRYRRFGGIQVNKGDAVTLVGEADGEDKAMLDFIEFIK